MSADEEAGRGSADARFDESELTWLERGLRLITDVRPGEGVTALLLSLNVFLVLCAYYVIKPVREALIGAVHNGPQFKSYTGAAIAATLFFAVPAYARFAAKWPRNKLIMRVSLFFIANLVGFYFLGLTPWVNSTHSEIGATLYAVGFLLWVGVFNMMIVAQFWAFAADVYSEAEGKRLFPLVALGASLGSMIGSLIVRRIVETLGTLQMMLVSAALLLAAAFVTQIVHRRAIERKKLTDRASSVAERNSERPSDVNQGKEAVGDGTAKESGPKQGAFGLVLHNKYLLLIAIFTLLFSFVNTSGEFMISDLVSKASALHADTREAQHVWIASYFGSYFFYVNLAGVIIQTFFVSRIIRYGGFKVGFMVYPVLAIISAGFIAFMPVLMMVRIGKTVENSVDYSLNNTVRNMLWLPTTRRMKYLAKQAVDSFFARLGDVGSALGIFILVNRLDTGVRGVAIMNVFLVAIWLYVAWRIVKEHTALTEGGATIDVADPPESPSKQREPGASTT